MANYDHDYSPEARGFSHSDPFDTRTYYTNRGHGNRDYMPSGRGGYEPGDLQTRWDHYNSANYGRSTGNPYRRERESYRTADMSNGRYGQDDYRYTSGNREWHFDQPNHPGRNERHHDRYNHPNRYRNMLEQNRNESNRDVFEWVGSGISNAWNSMTGNRRDDDRDRDYHRSYRDERRSYETNDRNQRQYGDRPIQGYEKGHRFADDTPERQQNIGDRNQRWDSDDYNR